MNLLKEVQYDSMNSTSFHTACTFERNMGIRRQIDYIFVINCFEHIYGKATCEIDLGSDHRAVYGCIAICSKKNRSKYKTQRSMKGWFPDNDEYDQSESY